MNRTFGFVLSAALLLAGFADAGAADKKYGPGVSDKEIKLGQTVPYSGPASAFSSYGRVMTGYFEMINEAGGINGRKITLISLDNAYSPPKALEQTRKLVEERRRVRGCGHDGNHAQFGDSEIPQPEPGPARFRLGRRTALQ